MRCFVQLYIVILVVTAEARRNKLLYIMLDGFRWDYIDKQELPGFTKLINEGVRAKWTNPLFPSLSYPTWTTLVTGLYPESHGIVGNYFYDPSTKDYFSQDYDHIVAQHKWWSAEPIWIAATKQGLRAASIFWSQCTVPYDGVLPEYCEPYRVPPSSGNYSEVDRLELDLATALDKLEQGYSLVQVYCEQPDLSGHVYGPDGEELKYTIRQIDVAIMKLMEQLKYNGLDKKVNIVIVSDHGMADIENYQHIELDDYLDTGLVEMITDNGAFLNIKVPSENVQRVYDQLTMLPGADVFRHDDIPLELHFKNHKYIHDFIIMTRPGYWISGSQNSAKMIPAEHHTYSGTHGYHPGLMDMKGIFFAKGPDFKAGAIIEAIDIVDIYQVVAHDLQISPRPHNGTWSHVEAAFYKMEADNIYGNSFKIANNIKLALFIAGILVVIIGAVLYVKKRSKFHYD